MVVNLSPGEGADYGPGWAMFCFRPGAFLSHNIGMATGRAAYQAGRLVATHVATVLPGGWIAEAVGGGYRIRPLPPLLDPDNREAVVWFRRPRGLTSKAADHMCNLARQWADQQVPYDYGALWGFTLSDPERRGQEPNFLESPRRLYCSEAYLKQLKAAEPLLARPLPPQVHARHESWWSPEDLNRAPGLWASPGNAGQPPARHP